jgi:hypothetical protein
LIHTLVQLNRNCRIFVCRNETKTCCAGHLCYKWWNECVQSLISILNGWTNGPTLSNAFFGQLIESSTMNTTSVPQ